MCWLDDRHVTYCSEGFTFGVRKASYLGVGYYFGPSACHLVFLSTLNLLHGHSKPRPNVTAGPVHFVEGEPRKSKLGCRGGLCLLIKNISNMKHPIYTKFTVNYVD